MARKASTRKYLLAFILTLFVFAGGIFIGVLFENVRLNHSNNIILHEKVGLQSLQLQQEYIDSGLADCQTLYKILEDNLDELGSKMGEVQEYERRSIFNEDEFDLQLQDYFLTQIQFFLISEEIDKKCPAENVKIIHFFDDNPYETQGDILAYLKKIFGEKVLIFSFDSNFRQEPMINILLSSYGARNFPFVAVGETTFTGHTDVDTLHTTICKELKRNKVDLPRQCRASS